MNDVQNRLAELLKAGVGDPPGRVTVEAVRRQRARRRTVAAAGVAAAVAIVVAVSAGLAGQLGRTGAAVRPTVSAAPAPCRPGGLPPPGPCPPVIAAMRWSRSPGPPPTTSGRLVTGCRT